MTGTPDADPPRRPLPPLPPEAPTVRTDGVVVTLFAGGGWTAHWPEADVSFHGGSARVDVTERDLFTHGATGSWAVGTSVARWSPDGDSVWIELTVAADIVTVQIGHRARDDEVIGLLTPVIGSTDIVPVARLVNGYDSWAYAGVVAGDRDGDSWWNTAFVDAAGRALAIQAVGTERFASRIATAEGIIVIESGGSPSMEFAGETWSDTWGYRVLEPAPMHLPVAAGEEVRSEPVALSAGTDAVGLVDRLAAHAGRVVGARRWAGDAIAGWESWYHDGLGVDTESVLAHAHLLRERFADATAGSPTDRVRIDVVQIDDGRQVAHGAWTPNEKFPADLAPLTAELRGLGARPGLWLAPFMVEPNAAGVATDHPDWLLRHASGHPLRDRHGKWALDASHPDAIAWLHELGAQVRTWGFEMVKLDFLYLGAQEAGRHDPRVTGTAALRNGLRAFCAGFGDDRYVLGCGMPMLPALGICHGNRVGPDLATPVSQREFGQPLAEGWSGWHGVAVQARNVAARFALRHWYDCDPDVVLAWGSDGATPDGYRLDESRTLATMAAMAGGPYFFADAFASLTTAERAVLEDPEILDLVGGPGFVPVDLFSSPEQPAIEHAFTTATGTARRWVARRRGCEVTATFNWADAPVDGIPPHAVRVSRAPS